MGNNNVEQRYPVAGRSLTRARVFGRWPVAEACVVDGLGGDPTE